MIDTFNQGRVSGPYANQDGMKDFVPDSEQVTRTEFARLRAAVETYDAARKRIDQLGHTLTTARERLDILTEQVKGFKK